VNATDFPFTPPEEPFRVIPPFDAADVYRQYLAKRNPRPSDELQAAGGMLSLGCALDAAFHASRVDDRKLAVPANTVAAYALLMQGHLPASLSRARAAANEVGSPDAIVLVSLLLRLSGDWLGALEAATDAGMRQPDPGALVIAGTLHFRGGRIDRARLALRRAKEVLGRGRMTARSDRARKTLRVSCDVYLALAALRDGDYAAVRTLLADLPSDANLAPISRAVSTGDLDEADAHTALARLWPPKRPEWRLFEVEMARKAAPKREAVLRFAADELAAARLFSRAGDAYLALYRAEGGLDALRSAAICAFRAGDTARAKERFTQARTADRSVPPSVFENYVDRGWGILDYAEAMVQSSRRALGQEHPRIALEHATVALDTAGEHPGARLAAAKALLGMAKLPDVGSPAIQALAAYQLIRCSGVDPRGLEPIVSVLGTTPGKR
jgi:tetratricopeptide (TPR) repeat protein